MKASTFASTCALLLGTAAPALAGPWTLPAGELRVGIDFIRWQADERFVGIPNVKGKPRERVELGTDIAGAELVQSQVALALTLGLHDRVQLTAWLPYLQATFEDDAQGFETVGTGDPILGADVRVTDHLAYGFDVKVPASNVPRTRQLPISEGQVDVTVWQRAGWAFGWHGWLSVDSGYRLRFAREDDLAGVTGGTIRRKPGNEFVALVGGGWRPGAPWEVRWFALTLDLDVLMGADGEELDGADNALQLRRRELIELRTGLLVEPLERLALSVSVGLPLTGLNYPAGPRVLASVAYRLAVW